MRKLTVALLVLCMLMWATSGAFASFSDTEGTDYEGAVATLTTLGLLMGYPDGTFRPDATITRAEFCAVAIRALGLEDAAGYAAGATIFPDVPATHWASGYINLAVDQGLIKGFPDGTFRPSAPVTYAESLAIVVRLLGYEPAVKGAWPTNYLIKAFELGLTGGLNFSAGAPASRGDIALFIDNALEIPLMQQVTVGDQETYQVVPGSSLLEDKLGFTAETGFVEETADVFGTALEDGEVMIGGETYSLAEGINLTDWLGMEVKVWLDGSTVVLASLQTDPDDFVDDVVTAVDVGTITFDDLEECFVTADTIEYCNFERDVMSVGAEAKVLVNSDDEIVSILAWDYDGSWVVTNVDADEEELSVALENGTQPSKYELGEDYDVYRVVAGGDVVDLDAVAGDDVIHYVDLGDYLYMLVVSDAVSGELEEVALTADDDIVLTVDGEDYIMAAAATSSTDANDTFAAIGGEGDLADFVGEDITLLLDKGGDVRHIGGDFVAPAADTVTAMITLEPYSWGPPADLEYYFKAMGLEGDVVKYAFTEDTTWDLWVGSNDGVTASPDWTTDADYGEFVELELDEDGIVTAVTELEFDVPPYDATDEGNIDGDYNRIQVAGDWYKVTSGTVFVDVGNAEIVSWSQFQYADDSDDSIGFGVLSNGDVTLEIIAFDGTVDTISYGVGADVGVVKSRVITADGVALKILTGGVTTTYLAADATVDSLCYENWSDVGLGSEITDIDVGELVEFEPTASGDEVEYVTEYACLDFTLGVDTYQFVYVTDIDTDNGVLDIRLAEDPDELAGDDYQVLLTPDTVYYDVTGTPAEATIDDIGVGDLLQLFGTESEITFVKIVEQ